jgi:hypothetical protein
MTIIYETIKNKLNLRHAWYRKLRWKNIIKITVEEIGWEGRVGANEHDDEPWDSIKYGDLP